MTKPDVEGHGLGPYGIGDIGWSVLKQAVGMGVAKESFRFSCSVLYTPGSGFVITDMSLHPETLPTVAEVIADSQQPQHGE